MDPIQLFVLTLDATLRMATPLILASMAGIFSERSGTIDIGLEGKILASAFAAGAIAAVTDSAWLGLFAAMGTSAMLALLHGFACITHRGNQVISGLAINILASGLTVILGVHWFNQGGLTPMLTSAGRFMPITFPFAEWASDIPVLGALYSEILSGHNILVYLAMAVVPLTWWVLESTRFGMRLRAAGENPDAVDTAGISVSRTRYLAVTCTGLLCGIAGAYLAIAHGAGFVKDMSAGKGFIALAAMIFGKWRPLGALYACLLFGFLDAAAARLQGVPMPLIGEVPVQLIQVLPYVATVVLLAGFIGKAIPPKAIGQPYLKER